MGTCIICQKVTNKSKSNDSSNDSVKFPEEEPEIILSVPRRKSLRIQNGIDDRNSYNLEARTSKELTNLKSKEEKNFLEKALKQHVLFRKFPFAKLKSLAQIMTLLSMEANEIVYNEGDLGYSFFLLYKGKLRSFNKQHSTEIMPGDFFGESALLESYKRESTVMSDEPSLVWKISRQQYFTTIKESSSETYLRLLAFVNSVPLLRELTPLQKENLSEELREVNFIDGQRIIEEGRQGDMLYIISSGEVVCTKGKKEIRRMTVGDYFGEQALLHDVPRTATITANGDVSVLRIGRDALSRALGDRLRNVIYKNSIRFAFDNSSKFRHLFKEEVSKILSKVKIFSLQAGEVLIQKHTLLDSALWIILRGSIRTEDSSLQFDTQSIIGDNIKEGEVSKRRYIAASDTDIAFVTYSDICQALGKDIRSTLLINSITESLSSVKLLRSLPKDQLQAVASRMVLRSYSAGETIIEEGEEGTEFFIIKTGRVNVSKDGVVIRSLEESAYFGERAILLNERRTASVIATDFTSCWVLSREDFFNFADEDLLSFLKGRMLLQEDSISLENLLFVKKVGEGSFGNVMLTVNPTSRALYCVKIVPKRKVIENKLYSSIAMERKILLSIDHPFIMKLVKTFKDDTHIYFLTEFVHGIEMADLLFTAKKFNEEQAKFYTACIVLMLEHLHDRQIVYRDLKPENLIVHDEGYPKLIDFGMSKILEGKTATILGTPHYMAPEIICGNSYGLAVDYWSLGILVYEFFTGSVPFGSDLENPFEIYESILSSSHLNFPPRLQSFTYVISFVRQLLSIRPVQRGNVNTMMKHTWFANFNWANLRLRKTKPPYSPSLKSLDAEVQEAVGFNKAVAAPPGPPVSVPLKYVNWDADF